MQEGEGVEGAGEEPSSLRRQGSASGQYVSRHPQAYRKTLPGKSEQSLRHARSCESGAGTFHQCVWMWFWAHAVLSAATRVVRHRWAGAVEPAAFRRGWMAASLSSNGRAHSTRTIRSAAAGLVE